MRDIVERQPKLILIPFCFIPTPVFRILVKGVATPPLGWRRAREGE